MKNPAPLFTHLCDVHDAFAKLVPAGVTLFPGCAEWAARQQAFRDQNSPEPRLSYNGLRHAMALTMLYADTPPAVVRDEMRELDTSPLAVAERLRDLIVNLAYNDIGYQPTNDEWARNRLLQNMALKIGNLFMIECLHALAREILNAPPWLTQRDGEYAYAYYDQKSGCLTDSSSSGDETGDDGVPLGITISPQFFVEAARGFSRLATSIDQLGRAAIALMHYGAVRTYTKDGLIEIIGLIADIESSNA